MIKSLVIALCFLILLFHSVSGQDTNSVNTITVQSFVDINGNNRLDINEKISPNKVQVGFGDSICKINKNITAVITETTIFTITGGLNNGCIYLAAFNQKLNAENYYYQFTEPLTRSYSVLVPIYTHTLFAPWISKIFGE